MDQPDVRRTVAASKAWTRGAVTMKSADLPIRELEAEHAARQDAIGYALAVLRWVDEREVTIPDAERYVCKAIAELKQMQEAGEGGIDG